MMAGFGFIGVLLMLLFWGGLILGAAWLVKGLFQARPRPDSSETIDGGLSARKILDQRFARGELTRDQYRRMRQDLDS